MEWFGCADVDFHTAAKPIKISEKDGSPRSLLDICEETVPPCNLNPLLFNGHLQTCWTAANKTAPPVHYKRRIFEAEHSGYSGSFTVDFFTPDAAADDEVDPSLPERTTYFSDEEIAGGLGSDDARPMLVILHGLSGGSHEVYLRHGIAPLLDSGAWEACVINSRGCAMSKITTGILYNARATWDTRQLVRHLRKTFPNRPLFGLGFSLGACILTNYLGEEGANCELKAAIACANPWNLELSSKALKRSFLGHNLYSRVLGTAMKKLVETHRAEIEKFTDLSMDELTSLTYLYEFDRVVQCAAWGYPTEDAYYRDASSVDAVTAIRIPYLAINCTDDPISAAESWPVGEFKQNPYTVLCGTSLGGHLGWFEVGGGRWHSKPITNFFNYMAFKADLTKIEVAKKTNDRAYHAGAEFNPMRRKMAVPLD
ncbi:hypothetical protein PG989_002510 [Apiospora arundinis]